MQKLKYKDKNIEINIVKSNIKNVYIQIKDNKVIVKAPKKISDNKILEIVNSKKDWIYKKIDNLNGCIVKDGSKIYILGKQYILNIYFMKDTEGKIQISEGNLIVTLSENRKNKNNTEIINELISNLYNKIAEKEVSMAMALVTRVVGIKPNKYRIKKIKTAWGTCTSNKNITINSELMKYDREVIQYVVLHEICHLRYMNHSNDFWNMVEKYMINYKEVRKRLKS